MTLAGALAEIDFTDLDNFADGFPHDLFAIHRREAPVYWHPPTDNTPDNEGFWSVATYAETLEVLKDPVTYSSVTGGERPYGGTLLQDLAIAGQVLNMMDDPRHSQIRRLVSSGLTPRMIRLVEDDLRTRARRLLDAVVPGEPFDFLVDIAAELPMQMICILLGVPESERHWLFDAIEPQFDFGGSRKASLSQLSVEEAGSRMYDYGRQLIASKRENPTDDMLSVVANAMLDDSEASALSDLELYLFFSLLFSAGAETTRNAVAGGLLALAHHPSQLRSLREDLGALPTAVEEMVRWTSPSPSKRRTATRDVTLGGRPIEAGQKNTDLGGFGES
ncbi:cytochrome P450 family protein [Mycobacterium intracellulare]|nr:cytochrome P450 family protein [Mycobacterium intracellulare]